MKLKLHKINIGQSSKVALLNKLYQENENNYKEKWALRRYKSIEATGK